MFDTRRTPVARFTALPAAADARTRNAPRRVYLAHLPLPLACVNATRLATDYPRTRRYHSYRCAARVT